MLYGICHLSLIAIRSTPSFESAMCSQLLYGEIFKVLEKRRSWSLIRSNFDDFEGWIQNDQYRTLTEEDYKKFSNEKLQLSTDLVEYVIDQHKQLMAVPMGSVINCLTMFKHAFEGAVTSEISAKEKLIPTALLYLNSPFTWGGRTPLGIDSSGFTQMVYRLHGHALKRSAAQQATQGEVLSFIEESEAGDLVFFDNAEGEICHVGMIMQDNYIIHVDEKVRIDRIDHSGIFNRELKKHTHQLRVIKKII